jgi:hypothetical protein
MYGFSVGNVLSKSFSIWGKNFAAFTLMTAIVMVPVLAVTVYMKVLPDEELTSNPTLMLSLTAAVALGSMFLGPLASGCVTYGVLQQLRGRHASVGDCFRVGMSRALAVMGVAIVAGLLIMLGTMLFCVPGLIFSAGYFVAAPAAVVERLGVHGSLSRSWQLTDGYRWSVFGLQILIGIIAGVAAQAIELPSAGSEGAVGAAFGIAAALVTVCVDSLKGVMGAVAYHDLRTEKEGASSQDLASVFD